MKGLTWSLFCLIYLSFMDNPEKSDTVETLSTCTQSGACGADCPPSCSRSRVTCDQPERFNDWSPVLRYMAALDDSEWLSQDVFLISWRSQYSTASLPLLTSPNHLLSVPDGAASSIITWYDSHTPSTHCFLLLSVFVPSEKPAENCLKTKQCLPQSNKSKAPSAIICVYSSTSSFTLSPRPMKSVEINTRW